MSASDISQLEYWNRFESFDEVDMARRNGWKRDAVRFIEDKFQVNRDDIESVGSHVNGEVLRISIEKV